MAFLITLSKFPNRELCQIPADISRFRIGPLPLNDCISSIDHARLVRPPSCPGVRSRLAPPGDLDYLVARYRSNGGGGHDRGPFAGRIGDLRAATQTLHDGESSKDGSDLDGT